MKPKSRDDHLFGPGPKRILALDGGGIRGVLTLGYLKRIEDILRQRSGGDPDFRLCDYFDLIGGTSTGSIIAAGLALGFSVEYLQEIYRNLANEVFKKPLLRLGLFSSKFPQEPLIEALTREFGNRSLGSEDLRTGLMIMTKRLDTGSPWVIYNNPKSKYFNSYPGSTAVPNRDFLLRQVVRSSAAAPHYFEPERFQVAEGVDGAFVDGGVTPFNNPALQLFMLATLEGYGLQWPVGANKMLLVSVGTGYQPLHLSAEAVMEMPAIQVAGQSLLSLMTDCDRLGRTILQWLSDSPTAEPINSELGDLQNDMLAGRKLLSYLRYNVRFNTDWIKDNIQLDLTEEQVNGLLAMDNPKNVQLLDEVGTKAAVVQVQEKHFSGVFDIEE